MGRSWKELQATLAEAMLERIRLNPKAGHLSECPDVLITVEDEEPRRGEDGKMEVGIHGWASCPHGGTAELVVTSKYRTRPSE